MDVQGIVALSHDVIPVDGLLTEFPLTYCARRRFGENSRPDISERDWFYFARVEPQFDDV